jgi:glycosyltransferase involved in cell wall biosynthesis
MAENRILFLAPASIPVNVAEAIVNVKLLKLLVSKGYKIDLISKKAKWEHYPLTQEEELQHSLESVTVIELDNKISFKTAWLHLRAWIRFGVVFKGVHWAFVASKVASGLIKKNRYSCVITKNYPSELAGYWLKRKYALPWVATWNDPYPHERFPEPYGKGPDCVLPLFKRPIIKLMSLYPDAHIFPSARLRDYMQGYLKAKAETLYVVPHIVESSGQPRVNTDDGVLKICYMGNLDGPRQPWTMIEAIKCFVEDNKHVPFKVDFIGTAPQTAESVVSREGLSEYIRFFRPVSYNESLKLLLQYDVTLIIEAPCQEGIFLPSKVSDAMAAGIVMFAVSPSAGVLNDLFKNGIIGYFADVTNPESIKSELERLVGDFSKGALYNTAIPVDYTPKAVGDMYDMIISNVSV